VVGRPVATRRVLAELKQDRLRALEHQVHNHDQFGVNEMMGRLLLMDFAVVENLAARSRVRNRAGVRRRQVRLVLPAHLVVTI